MAVIHTTKIGQVEGATSSQNIDPTTEINNHTNMTVLGLNCLPLYDFERPLDVSGWDARSRSVECTTIYGAIAYDHPISGQVSLTL